MTHLLAISGSLRQASLNTALLRAAQALLPEGVTLTLLSIADVPLYDGDLEARQFPAAVQALQRQIQQADGLLLATPEYNHGVPGVLKNALDWLSRPSPDAVFAGLPVGVIGATPGGFATVRAQDQWLPVLRYLKCMLYTRQELAVSRAHDKFSPDGMLQDDRLRAALQDYLAGFAAFAQQQRHSAQSLPLNDC